MAIEEDSNEVIPTFDDSYYEERASVEEIYLEETEEELRAGLIAHRSDNSSAETGVNSNRNGEEKSFQQEAAYEKTNRGVRG